MDSGGWIFAQEILLEPPPPLSSFQGRRPNASELAESYHSKLVDSRWADLMLHRVKELEGYLEAKRKLGRGKPLDSNSPADDDEAAARRRRGGGRGGKNEEKPGPSGGPGK